MFRLLVAVVIVLVNILPNLAHPQPALVNGIFVDPDLSFRYTPPPGMFDETDSSRESVRTRAAALHSTAVFDVLLALGVGDDTSPEWFSVGIETFPRARLSTFTDSAAKARINVLAAGARALQIGRPKELTFSGRGFIVSDFEQDEPPLKKHAQVYSTIVGDKFLVFAFAANSAGGVKVAADTMRTLEFANERAAFLGFDRNEYPGDENLQELHKAFAFAGYWLNNPPGSKTNTWVGKRGKIEAAGFGFLVLFNGRVYRELGTRAAELGKSDAEAAIAAARREGFPAKTIIFLDQEEGGRLLPEQKAYLFAWVDEINHQGFRDGVYCSGIAFRETSGASVITAEDIKQNAGGRDITYWVTNDACPPSPGCKASARPPAPNVSGLAFAEVWQFAQSPRRKDVASACGGYNKDGDCYSSEAAASQNLHVDLNSARSADPSHGRKSAIGGQ